MNITRLAPAKINLMLHVVGRQVDGYHHLQTLVIFAEYGDEIRVGKAESSSLTIDGPFAPHVPLSADNTVILAARWVKERFPIVDQVHIHLTKNLPIASGMGGGSSDAAATIAALLSCHEISLTSVQEDALILASGELGADVPMCLAHQFGRGPLLWIDSSGRESLPLPINVDIKGVMVLVNPGVPVSTPAIFKKIQPPYTDSQDFKNLLENHFQGNVVEYLKAQKNDLMESATTQEAKIGKLLQALQKAPGCLIARMSGSGATCFAVFEDEELAKSALIRKMPKAWGVTCNFWGSFEK
jgi:4-diphosphocytidyl-2-C-methyl-D-erythritol kinase